MKQPTNRARSSYLKHWLTLPVNCRWCIRRAAPLLRQAWPTTWTVTTSADRSLMRPIDDVELWLIPFWFGDAGVSSANKTPAVSPASTPSWDPFGNQSTAANANSQGILLRMGLCHWIECTFELQRRQVAAPLDLNRVVQPSTISIRKILEN